MQAIAPASAQPASHHPTTIPSIRLISATPSSTGLSSSEATNSPATFARALEDSWAATAAASNISLPLAPKVEPNSAKKKLVPKKSKLGIFSSSPFSSSARERDVKVSSSSITTTGGGVASTKDEFSDGVRRVGSDAKSGGGEGGKGGFEIYVDPEVDPDIGEILVIRKRPSKIRGGLGGVGWGADGEVPPVPPKPVVGLLSERTNGNGNGGDEFFA